MLPEVSKFLSEPHMYKSLPKVIHCGFLLLGNTQKILKEIWHHIWDKNDVKIYAIGINLKFHEPFQSYQLTAPANSARKAG